MTFSTACKDLNHPFLYDRHNSHSLGLMSLLYTHFHNPNEEDQDKDSHVDDGRKGKKPDPLLVLQLSLLLSYLLKYSQV